MSGPAYQRCGFTPTPEPTFVTNPNTMDQLITVLQIVVAFSVSYVWIFRYHNVVTEFKLLLCVFILVQAMP